MVNLIEEYKRDESLDYLKILKALSQIPFNVGKTLLTDFLTGDYKNKSIVSNKLDELNGFGSLNVSRDKITEDIDNLIERGLIEQISADYNRFAKLLRLTIRGQNEIIKPTLREKNISKSYNFKETEIASSEREIFKHLEHFLDGYNDSQKKAIIDESKNILCIAGAGSGKTTVLTKRVEFLVRYKSIPAEKILAITFTRKAKEEMESRLKALNVSGVNIHTFNSFCEDILRKNESEIYSKKMRVQSYSDKILSLNLSLLSLGLDIKQVIDGYFNENQRKFKDENQLINSFMNDCFYVLEYFKTTGKEHDFSKNLFGKERENAVLITKIVALLRENMELQGLRDYTDQIIDAIKFFKKDGSKIPKFEHVLIDEYQDISQIQIELMNLIKSENLFIVGDPRQAIFGWRGSDIKYILDFQKEKENLSVIHLTKNYRSSKEIVNLMNLAIKNMDLPGLENNINKKSTIELNRFDTEEEEMDFIVDKISNSETPLDNIFVLSRTNRQIMELSQKLKEKTIPHSVKTDDIRGPISYRPGEVLLATVHAIKGLEARKVFVMGCNEQNFPCKASDHPAIEMLKLDSYNKTEEERRLFYVAISRAKEFLHLTYTGQKPTYFITKEMQDIIKSL